MRAAAALAIALSCTMPVAAQAASDLAPSVSRTYVIDTHATPADGGETTASSLELELTTFRTADGAPALRYRTVPGSRRYRTQMLTVLVRAFDRTPIEIRLSPDGIPVGLVDWPNQRVRLAEAVRAAGRDLNIDATKFGSPIEHYDEAIAMIVLVDEVRLLSLLQTAPAGEVDRQTCTIRVTRHQERTAPAEGLIARDEATGKAHLSKIDGWAIDAEVAVRTQYSDGGDETVRYSFRRLSPPDPSTCPAGRK